MPRSAHKYRETCAHELRKSNLPSANDQLELDRLVKLVQDDLEQFGLDVAILAGPDRLGENSARTVPSWLTERPKRVQDHVRRSLPRFNAADDLAVVLHGPR